MEFLAYYLIIGMCFWGHFWKRSKKDAESLDDLKEYGDNWLLCILFWPIVPVVYIADKFSNKKKNGKC
jgi:hypothetical protein